MQRAIIAMVSAGISRITLSFLLSCCSPTQTMMYVQFGRTGYRGQAAVALPFTRNFELTGRFLRCHTATLISFRRQVGQASSRVDGTARRVGAIGHSIVMFPRQCVPSPHARARVPALTLSTEPLCSELMPGSMNGGSRSTTLGIKGTALWAPCVSLLHHSKNN